MVPELAEGLGLDLPYPLPRDTEQAAYFLQSARAAVRQAVPQLDDLPLTLPEGGEHSVQMLPQQQKRGRLHRTCRIPVLDQIPEGDLVLLPHRGMQGHGLLRQAQDLAHPLRRELEVGADLLGSRLVPPLLEHAPLHADHPVDQLHHMHGYPYRAGLVGERPRHRLPDPPRRVRRELVPPRVVELLHRADEPEVALLDQVEHGQPPPDVPLGDGDDEAQVGLDEAALGHAAHDHDPVQVEREPAVERGGGAELLLGEEPGLHPAGEFDLLGGGEQGDAADLTEVLAEQVGGGAAALGAGGAGHGGDGLVVAGQRLGWRLGSVLRRGLRGRRRVAMALRGHGPEQARLGTAVGAAGHLREGVGLHGGDLQDDRCSGGCAAAARRSAKSTACAPGDSGTAPSVGYDTSSPRESCGDFLLPVRDRVVIPGRGGPSRERPDPRAAAPGRTG
ncbi:hypothetical protein GCM10017776_05820 [Streptomyces griseoluteus]|nr:hypothetical protein GCM10017776_05820 [Streptomyces griseoluteus]